MYFHAILTVFMKRKANCLLLPVAYAENFRGGAKFRQNRMTSQINLGKVPKARSF